MTTGIAVVDFYVSLWEDNTCGADWYYHCCRFKFRFHRIIVSLVAYGTEVGRVLKISFFFFFFCGVVLRRKQKSSSSSPRRLFTLYRCRDFCVRRQLLAFYFFSSGKRREWGRGEKNSLDVCVCLLSLRRCFCSAWFLDHVPGWSEFVGSFCFCRWSSILKKAFAVGVLLTAKKFWGSLDRLQESFRKFATTSSVLKLCHARSSNWE